MFFGLYVVGIFMFLREILLRQRRLMGVPLLPGFVGAPKVPQPADPEHLSRLYLNQSISQTPSRNSHLWIKHLSEQLQQNFTSKLASTSAVRHPIRSGLKTKSRGKKAKSRGLWGKYVSGQEAAREATFCPHKNYPPASAPEYGAPPNF